MEDWRHSKLPCGPESETVSDILKLNVREGADSLPSRFISWQAPDFGIEGILIVWKIKIKHDYQIWSPICVLPKENVVILVYNLDLVCKNVKYLSYQ